MDCARGPVCNQTSMVLDAAVEGQGVALAHSVLAEANLLTYMVLFLVLVGGSAVLHWRQRPSRALRHALAWAAIALVLLAGYS